MEIKSIVLFLTRYIISVVEKLYGLIDTKQFIFMKFNELYNIIIILVSIFLYKFVDITSSHQLKCNYFYTLVLVFFFIIYNYITKT